MFCEELEAGVIKHVGPHFRANRKGNRNKECGWRKEEEKVQRGQEAMFTTKVPNGCSNEEREIPH